jgi:hypothetical protein
MEIEVLPDEESLEELAERIERAQALEEEDEKAILDELIEEIADIRAEPVGGEDLVREDEFVCRLCGMILNRSMQASWPTNACVDCFPAYAGASVGIN